jgi:hypothetical protein
MLFSGFSIELPKDRFQTLMSGFSKTTSLIFFKMVADENFEAVAIPKCLTLKLPHPSSSLGFKLGPSTIIEQTFVPCS